MVHWYFLGDSIIIMTHPAFFCAHALAWLLLATAACLHHHHLILYFSHLLLLTHTTPPVDRSTKTSKNYHDPAIYIKAAAMDVFTINSSLLKRQQEAYHAIISRVELYSPRLTHHLHHRSKSSPPTKRLSAPRLRRLSASLNKPRLY